MPLDFNQLPIIKGRGSSSNLANRFERVRLESEFEQLDVTDQQDALFRKVETEYYYDDSESIVSQNDSPDVDFNYSLNPYRGCAHGCSYCYARPSHEYLGFNAGLEFESKIMVKKRAPELFRKWLMRDSWHVEPIALSGVTDCYQQCERQFELTRNCLQIAAEMRQPMKIITKNGLIRRDTDILGKMAADNLISVAVSVTTMDQTLTRIMEPRTSSPRTRLDTIAALAKAGVPVRVLIAPIIPGLNDAEVPQVLRLASDAGATAASYVMLRLPLSVEPIFLAWLDQHFSDRKNKILDRIRSLRNGRLNRSDFRTRMVGEGVWSDQMKSMFKAFCHKYKLQRTLPDLRTDLFRKVDEQGRQQGKLF